MQQYVYVIFTFEICAGLFCTLSLRTNNTKEKQNNSRIERNIGIKYLQGKYTVNIHAVKHEDSRH